MSTFASSSSLEKMPLFRLLTLKLPNKSPENRGYRPTLANIALAHRKQHLTFLAKCCILSMPMNFVKLLMVGGPV